ncbi:lipocalin-15 [Tiliqua scincoides]|uniref:lipocalin-15 n=1 Tax=Tiliqua scincoides TaxID=71010 RepID=UPI0034635FA8
MKAVLLGFVVLLFWVFCVQAEVVVQPDFDIQKFAGTWQIVGGISNCPVFQGMKEIMKTSAAIVKPLPNGDLEITTGFPFPEECKKMVIYFTKTDQPGHFSNKDKMATRDMRVMETDYINFAFVYTFKVPLDKTEASSTTIQLYTRTSDASPEVLEKFKKHYHDVGLTDDLMIMLPKSGECAQISFLV